MASIEKKRSKRFKKRNVTRKWTRYKRNDEPSVDTSDPTTSGGSCPMSSTWDHRVGFEKGVENSRSNAKGSSASLKESSSVATQPLKSIMRSEPSKRSRAATVRFHVEEDTDQVTRDNGKPSYLDRLKRFWRNPACRVIFCFLFGVLLPCSLIYAGLLYLYYLRQRTKLSSRWKLASR